MLEVLRLHSVDDRMINECGAVGECNWKGKPKYQDKINSIVTLLAINLTQSDLGLNPGGRSRKPTTNQ
jgi:hypothetical protein